MTGRAYCLRVGFGQKARVSGLGIVHIMVLRLILLSFCVIPFFANSLVYLCDSISCKGAEIISESFVFQVMARKN